MNEKGLVNYLTENFDFPFGKGIGDDTSVTSTGSGSQLITKDVLVEDVHFRLRDFSLQELALKALAVNLSDIAAMGGVPRYFYLGLGFPQKLGEPGLYEFFNGLKEGCDKWQVYLAGGDYSASKNLFISITVVGDAYWPVYRNGAKEGDLIGVTGTLGASALGLQLLERGIDSGHFVEAHKNPQPQVQKGLKLAPPANAMIDISDGLLIDLQRILDASQKGAHIRYEDIPKPDQLENVCREHELDPVKTVLTGGEDYQLLFTLPPEDLKQLQPDQYHIIGQITPEPGQLTLTHNNQPLTLPTPGYDHFLQ